MSVKTTNFCLQGLTKVPINCMENIVDALIGRQQLREYVLLQLPQLVGRCHHPNRLLSTPVSGCPCKCPSLE